MVQCMVVLDNTVPVRVVRSCQNYSKSCKSPITSFDVG